jgi:uncharacterized protein
VPILLIYRRYYGTAMALRISAIFYAAMATAGYVIEFAFAPLGLVPSGARHAHTGDVAVSWNYTTVLNIAFLLIAAALVWRFFATGGRPMLAMMGGAAPANTDTGHHHC